MTTENQHTSNKNEVLERVVDEVVEHFQVAHSALKAEFLENLHGLNSM